jgi:hypothetical protein
MSLAVDQIAAPLGFDSIAGPPHHLRSALGGGVEILFYPLLPVSEVAFLFGKFPGFACLSVW